eukprot:GHVS01014233.1.p1 GENE.GHVS01014233.1~~GHVS01014233.1.p1  ORF type:complete len:431 (+),score=30.82 GHVS01014233.1:49-1341(+)
MMKRLPAVTMGRRGSLKQSPYTSKSNSWLRLLMIASLLIKSQVCFAARTKSKPRRHVTAEDHTTEPYSGSSVEETESKRPRLEELDPLKLVHNKKPSASTTTSAVPQQDVDPPMHINSGESECVSAPPILNVAVTKRDEGQPECAEMEPIQGGSSAVPPAIIGGTEPPRCQVAPRDPTTYVECTYLHNGKSASHCFADGVKETDVTETVKVTLEGGISLTFPTEVTTFKGFTTVLYSNKEKIWVRLIYTFPYKSKDPTRNLKMKSVRLGPFSYIPHMDRNNISFANVHLTFNGNVELFKMHKLAFQEVGGRKDCELSLVPANHKLVRLSYKWIVGHQKTRPTFVTFLMSANYNNVQYGFILRKRCPPEAQMLICHMGRESSVTQEVMIDCEIMLPLVDQKFEARPETVSCQLMEGDVSSRERLDLISYLA